jgi:hypothetical protein
MTAYEQAIASARAKGEEHGRSAATWYFDGNTTRETYERVLQGIEGDDPEILDTFPSSPLSGEWSGDPTPASVLDGLAIGEDDDRADDLLSAYEDGFYTASSEWIELAAIANTFIPALTSR